MLVALVGVRRWRWRADRVLRASMRSPGRPRPSQDEPGGLLSDCVWGAWCFSDWGSFSSRESIGWRPCQQRNTPTSSRPKWCVR